MNNKSKSMLAMWIIVCMLSVMIVPAFARDVSDITGHWAEKKITKFLSKGWVVGYPNGKFGPNDQAKRVQFITMMNNVFNLSEKAPIDYPDVPAKAWYAVQVAKAKAAQYLTLFEDGTVRPESKILRSDAGIMLANYLQLESESAFDSIAGFTDLKNSTQKVKEVINALVKNGIMKGYNKTIFKPDGTLTRAEAVEILNNALNYLDSKAALKKIVAVEVSNGKATITLDGPAEGLTAEDFILSAKLDGKTCTLEKVMYSPTDYCFTFQALPTANLDQTFEISVSAAKESSKITGTATANVIIGGTAPAGGTGGSSYSGGGSTTPTSGGNTGNPRPTAVPTSIPSPSPTPMPTQQPIILESLQITYITPTPEPTPAAEISQTGQDSAVQFSVRPDIKAQNVLVSFYEGDRVLAESIPASSTDQVHWTAQYILESIPTRIVITAIDINGIQYVYDSQDKVWVDKGWSGLNLYTSIETGKIFGLNAFAEIQQGVDGVNSNGTVIVAKGEYPVYPNERGDNFGIVIYKPLTLLGAQANVKPVENEVRGEETVITSGTSDEEENGGGAITLCKNAGAVEINGFTFKFNELALDVTLYNGEEPEAPNAEGIMVHNNRFIDNGIDVLIDNNDSKIQNYHFLYNVFGLNETTTPPTINLSYVRKVVDGMHSQLEDLMESSGSYLEIDLSIGMFVQNPQGLEFRNNTVYGKTIGLGVMSCSDANNTVGENYFHGNRFGIGLLACGSSQVSHTVNINYNLLTNNTVGLASLLGGKIDATKNYWGDVNWTNIRTALLGEVDVDYGASLIEYFPWALDSTCTKIANADITQIIINPAWAGKTTGQQVIYNGKDYYLDVNAYMDIKSGVTHSAEDYAFWYLEGIPVLNALPGNYIGDIEIYTPMILQTIPDAGNAVIKGTVRILSGGEDEITLRNLTVDGDIEVYSEGKVNLSGCLVSGAISFKKLPGTINGKTLEEITPNEISAANHNANVKFAANDITSFVIQGQTGTTEIDGLNHTIVFHMPYRSQVTSLKPVIGISPKATLEPGSEAEQDFTAPVTYTVSSYNDEKQNWVVTCVVDPVISGFTVPNQVGTTLIDGTAKAITFHMPFGTEVSKLAPQITLVDGAVLASITDPALGQDFSQPVIYTVTLEGEESQEWVATCIVDKNTEKAITAFEVENQIGATEIDTAAFVITFRMYGDVDISALVPKNISISANATISPAVTETQDFRVPVSFMVTAEDGTTQEWIVNCIPMSNENDILSFIVQNQAGETKIDSSNHTVEFHMAAGTDVTKLTPVIVVSHRAIVSPASGDYRNFASPLIYSVIAEDGTVQDWIVGCIVDPPEEEHQE